ncbi:MAG: prolyl oligopeptidase family serine peptidase [Chitinophagaceae bacterium]|nr:prolyl oligopeptidase family serine peptidase [Chitinophagaceae bacterium]
MIKTIFSKIVLAVLAISSLSVFAKANSEKMASGEYILVVEGYDWGPAVSKVILELDTVMSAVDYRDFSVFAERSSDCAAIPAASKIGNRAIAYAYVSDNKGNRVNQGNFATLVLTVAPNMPLSSPFQYSVSGKCRGNSWVEYKLTVTNTKSNKIWNKQGGRIMPLIDEFDLSGKFNYEEGKTMSYASFAPKIKKENSPLIIWLHGGGEGGSDPTIPLLGNKAANYASAEIQTIFGGAYVLVPQCPGAWMHNKDAVTTHGKEDDVYNKGLLALIKDFVNNHPEIDKKRIYVGGCSNGGYMALKLMLVDPNYFAAAYISALAYQSQYITDEQIKSIQNIPVWFVHSKDDPTTIADKTVVPVYQRLKAAGAKNIHFSFYDHVTDLSGFFGGENFYYNGHWSWIYSHVNHAKLDYDGKPVVHKGKQVTIMEWMAAQTK